MTRSHARSWPSTLGRPGLLPPGHATHDSDMTPTTVETAGGLVTGAREDDVVVFRGIPFAQPPVGRLRFRPPEPAEPWTGELDATSFGPIAVQSPSPLENLFGGRQPPTDEDCLRLNVWAPAGDGDRRPVLVWIHGGA